MEPATPQQTGQWTFTPDKNQTTDPSPAVPAAQSKPTTEVSWSASEFIAYHKNVGWYMLAVIGLFVFAGAVFLLSGGDFISSGSILLIGVLSLTYASRKPRVLTYQITKDGVRIGEKLYTYGTIKSFALIDEGAFRSISLLPMQRFMPAISMYFEPQDESKIVEALSGFVPREERKQDVVDRMMHKIRF